MANDVYLIKAIANLYACSVLGFLPTNQTNISDKFWLAEFKQFEDYPLVILNLENDLSVETSKHGKLCLTSFSPTALKQWQEERRPKRAIKILLQINATILPKVELFYQSKPLDFDSPPVVALQSPSEGKDLTPI